MFVKKAPEGSNAKSRYREFEAQRAETPSSIEPIMGWILGSWQSTHSHQ